MRVSAHGRGLVIVAAPLLVTATAALVPAAGASAVTAPAAPVRSFQPRGVLNDVAAISARSAWAVGRTGVCRPATLIAHWNGRAWKLMRAPVSARAGWLNSVAVTSAHNAWAVGFSGTLNVQRPLILRWNGKVWTHVARLTGGGLLSGVAATSAHNAWAVGSTGSGKTLILRWNGKTWKRLPKPSLSNDFLAGVAATSARNAWAVGETGGGKTLILHWNGTSWARVPSPSLAGDNFLAGVAASSPRNAWAVGETIGGKAEILHWTGMSWTEVASPVSGAQLAQVTAMSAGSAWAVGATSGLTGAVACAGNSSPADIAGRLIATEPGRLIAAGPKTVILRWNGSQWQRESSPDPASKNALLGVAATSARNAWAVGATGNVFGATAKALILRWRGHTWQ